MAPFTVALGEEPTTLFLRCKALKARVGEQYYYGCCFLFSFSLWVLRVWFFSCLGKKKVVGGAASAGEIFI